MLRINKKQLQFFYKAGRAKIIYADSMPRSGSTLIFNALRLLLQSNPDCDLQSSWVRDARHLPRANTYLIKTHGMNVIDAWRASNIVYSYRDPRVALISMSRKFGATPSIELVRQWMRDAAFAESRACMMIRYEDMMADLPATVNRLADLICCHADCDKITETISRLSVRGGGPSDAATLFHKDHQTGTRDDEWRTLLPEALQVQINAEFAPWLERHNYPLTLGQIESVSEVRRVRTKRASF